VWQDFRVAHRRQETRTGAFHFGVFDPLFLPALALVDSRGCSWVGPLGPPPPPLWPRGRCAACIGGGHADGAPVRGDARRVFSWPGRRRDRSKHWGLRRVDRPRLVSPPVKNASPSRGQTLVKHWSNTKRTGGCDGLIARDQLHRRWSSGGRSASRSRPRHTGQIPVRHWPNTRSDTGRTLAAAVSPPAGQWPKRPSRPLFVGGPGDQDNGAAAGRPANGGNP
jgi:hypothetical protein